VGLDLSYERPDPSRLSDSDVVFCCVHHTASMRIVPSLLDSSKVIDLSADYRFSDKRIYEEVYGVAHSSPDIEAVYGLPELHREEIRAARLVANPGCYPTGAILALAPLVSEGLIDLDRIVIDSKSGSSGAGIKASPLPTIRRPLPLLSPTRSLPIGMPQRSTRSFPDWLGGESRSTSPLT